MLRTPKAFGSFMIIRQNAVIGWDLFTRECCHDVIYVPAIGSTTQRHISLLFDLLGPLAIICFFLRILNQYIKGPK